MILILIVELSKLFEMSVSVSALACSVCDNYNFIVNLIFDVEFFAVQKFRERYLLERHLLILVNDVSIEPSGLKVAEHVRVQISLRLLS